jgi:hypothetical protein
MEAIDFLNGGLRYHNRWSFWKFDPNTGLVNVEGDFNCSDRGLTDFKGVRFGTVTGDFICSHNKLTSLVGAPLEVGENFDCSYNHLTSLEGGPQKVDGTYDCSKNKLVTLKGSPIIHKDKFICSDNELKDLVGAPEIIKNFRCPVNIDMFVCARNQLKSLEGAPIIKNPVGGFPHANYYGNKGIPGRLLKLVHEIMIKQEVPLIVALGIAKKDMKPGEFKKFSIDIIGAEKDDNTEAILKGASMLGGFNSI